MQDRQTGTGGQQSWAGVLLVLTGSVALNKSLNLSELQFPYLERGLMLNLPVQYMRICLHLAGTQPGLTPMLGITLTAHWMGESLLREWEAAGPLGRVS